METGESSHINGIWQGDDHYRQLSECSQALQGLELENFKFFKKQMFGFQPNISFQTINASQNPNDLLQTSPSFLHLLASDGSINSNHGYPFASYWKINDKDDQGNMRIAIEVGSSSNLANILGNEV